MSTSAIDKAFAGKAFTSSQKPAVRARVSRSAVACRASQEKKNDVALKAAGAALGALAAVQLGLAGPAAAEINFDSARSGAPAQNKEAVNLPSTFFKAGDTLQEKLGFTEDADNQGSKIGKPSFPNASQEDLKIEKTAKDTQKGLEKSFQNITPDTSDLPNPFEGVGTGAGSIADKTKGAAKDVGKNLDPSSSNLPNPSAAADKASGAIKGLVSGASKGTKNVSLDLSENIPNLFKDVGKNAEKAKSGNPQDIGKNDPLAGLPNPGQAVDAVKGLAGDAKQGGKNVASDLSEDIPNLFKDVGKNAEKAKSGNAQDIGKNDPLAGLPNPGQAVDAVKGLAGDAKQGGKNVASDLSDLPNPFDSAGAGSIADKAKGAAKDVGKNLNPGSNNLPNPGAAADKASGAIKGLASDAGKGTKNVSLDLSENIPNLFSDVGKNAEKAKTGRVDEIGKNDPLAGLPNPGAAADKALGELKGLGGNPLEGLGDKAKGSAKDLGKGLPDPSDAADQAKGLASDAKSKVKEEANVAGDVSDLPNPFDGAGGIADQAKGAVKDVGKNLNPGSNNLPDPSAAADKAAGKAKSLASDAKSAVKGSNV
ncbi:g2854 [Coccomyxa viridis]|uniref:G2854 protein n=1 Tax=Coccomyxa viridis TaxID=1274662 RepID=A0ABP1FQE2_9CHLO